MGEPNAIHTIFTSGFPSGYLCRITMTNQPTPDHAGTPSNAPKKMVSNGTNAYSFGDNESGPAVVSGAADSPRRI